MLWSAVLSSGLSVRASWFIRPCLTLWLPVNLPSMFRASAPSPQRSGVIPPRGHASITEVSPLERHFPN